MKSVKSLGKDGNQVGMTGSSGGKEADSAVPGPVNTQAVFSGLVQSVPVGVGSLSQPS